MLSHTKTPPVPVVHNPNPNINTSATSFPQRRPMEFAPSLAAAPLVIVTPPFPFEIPGKFQVSDGVSPPLPLPLLAPPPPFDVAPVP